MGFFDENAPTDTRRPYTGTPYIPPEWGGGGTTTLADTMAPYVPPTGGINPDGMYSGTQPPIQSGTSGPSTPAATGNAQNAQQLVQQWTAGKSPTQANYEGLIAYLQSQGIPIERPTHAGGTLMSDDKIVLPGGQVIDVISNQGGPGASWGWGDSGYWVNGKPASDPYGSPPKSDGGNFQTGTFTGGGQYPLASVMGEGWYKPWTTPFTAPTDVTQQNDPGWQFRMKEGLGAIQRAAASRGTLLTGGAVKDLNAFAQDFASNEYDKVYGRALGEYRQAYGIYSDNQNNAFSRPFEISRLGFQGAAELANSASGYKTNSAENRAGGANAAAAGRVSANNANTKGWAYALNTGLDYLGTWDKRYDGSMSGNSF